MSSDIQEDVLNQTYIQKSKDVEIKCTQSQYNAIVSDFTTPGSLLNIIAGPGSGKTRTLCSRIAYILGQNNGISPDNMLILSMTNRSVKDIKFKLKDIVGEELTSMCQILTFHGFGSRILTEKYGDQWGVLEDEDLKRIADLIPLNKTNKPKKRGNNAAVFKEIIKYSRLIDNDLSNYEESALFLQYNFDKESFLKLREFTKKNYMFTYDGILDECLLILKDPEYREKLLAKYSVIIVDEFQDVYLKLIQILQEIVKEKHLTVAGDPDQSIYRFLGATNSKNWGRLIPMYEKDNIKTIRISESFRSNQDILKISQKLLKTNSLLESPVEEDQEIKEYYNHNGTSYKSIKSVSNSFKPVRVVFRDQIEEYEFIKDEIKKIISFSKGAIKHSDIAILSYTNRDIDAINDYFQKKQYFKTNKLTVTPKWLTTPISYFLQYIRILIDPRQNFPLLSAIRLLPGVGLTTMNTIYLNATREDTSVWDFLKCGQPKRKLSALKHTKEFVEYIDSRRKTLDFDDPNDIVVTLLEIGSKFGLQKEVDSNITSLAKENEYKSYVRHIHRSLKSLVASKPAGKNLLEYYLLNYNTDVQTTRGHESVTALSPEGQQVSSGDIKGFSQYYDDEEINLSTIHTSKGLEFPIVFILSSNAITQSAERNRVLYVGMTRASSLLYWNNSFSQVKGLFENQIIESLIDHRTSRSSANTDSHDKDHGKVNDDVMELMANKTIKNSNETNTTQNFPSNFVNFSTIDVFKGAAKDEYFVTQPPHFDGANMNKLLDDLGRRHYHTSTAFNNFRRRNNYTRLALNLTKFKRFLH